MININYVYLALAFAAGQIIAVTTFTFLQAGLRYIQWRREAPLRAAYEAEERTRYEQVRQLLQAQALGVNEDESEVTIN